MRAIGASERCLDLMVQRSQARTTFGRPLSEQGVIQEWIAEARIRIEQARLLVLKTAWMIDNVGAKAARTEIAAIKVVAPDGPHLRSRSGDAVVRRSRLHRGLSHRRLSIRWAVGCRSQTGRTRCTGARWPGPNWVVWAPGQPARDSF